MAKNSSSESKPAVPEADANAIAEALARPFNGDEVHWKPQTVTGNRALVVAFVDARAIQDRLDDVLGVMGWQDSYEPLPDGSVVCRLKIKIGAEWITKEDVGGQSEQPDEGDRRKAAFSDALKRAAVKFGVGRYLYRLKPQWVDYDAQKRRIVGTPVLPDDKQATAPKAEKAAPKAKPDAGGKGLPADGKELLGRLQAKDAKLATEGVSKQGELLAYVKEAGAKEGFKGKLDEWSGAAVELAVGAVKAFEAARRAPAATKPADDRASGLAARLDAFEAKLIDAGLCPPGQVVAAVRKAMGKAFEGDYRQWPQEQAEPAIAAAQAFARVAKEKKVAGLLQAKRQTWQWVAKASGLPDDVGPADLSGEHFARVVGLLEKMDPTVAPPAPRKRKPAQQGKGG